jgi:glutamate-1-semialdehyde 2,1-aminomutase
MPTDWSFSDADRKAAEEVGDFLPDRVFDIHAHLWRKKDWRKPVPAEIEEGPDEAGIGRWRDCVGRWIGDSRLEGGFFLAVPFVDIERGNDFLVDQLGKNPASRGAVAIAPDTPEEKALLWLDRPAIVGLKPYHTFSPEKPTFQLSPDRFIPDWAWRLAAERRLIIVLHLVKSLALRDAENQRYLQRMCRSYPSARVILAHAARGFHSPNTVRGISSLRGLENVFFDTSAICEPASLLAVLDEFGPRKLLWGSDFWVSETRGKCVAAGDGFVWLNRRNVNWENVSPPVVDLPVGIESLRALRDASAEFGLNGDDRNDIFHDNAKRLLGLAGEERPITQELYSRARNMIPGGTQLLSKRPEQMAPGQWPAYFREARGCEVWDLDGRHYFDMSTNGISTCLLGYRDPDVTRAVQRRIRLGAMSSLNPPEEVELADRLLAIHPWAERIRFARSGGEAMAVAVRIARATTDRSMLAICGYSGWHDWYLAANLGEDDPLRGHLLPGLQPLGVPRELRGTVLAFHANNREEFSRVVHEAGERLAAVVMEPCHFQPPEPGFLEYVRDECHRLGAVLVFDEITIGWRLHFGGSHLKFGVNPDIAVYAKAMGNGHPMAAIIGTRRAMEGAHGSFISSTYWTESVGPAAALATLGKMSRIDVPAIVDRAGRRAMAAWKTGGEKFGLPVVTGDCFPCLARFSFQHPSGNALRTLYTQWMLEEGFLAGPQFSPTLAHTDEILDAHAEAVDRTFKRVADAFGKDEVLSSLKGPEAHTGFTRLT